MAETNTPSPLSDGNERKHVIAAISRIQMSPWALCEERVPMSEILLFTYSGEEMNVPGFTNDAEIITEVPSADMAKIPRLPKVAGRIGVIPIRGVIGQHRDSDFWSDTATDSLGAQLATLLGSPAIGAIVFDIDSPGGIVYGTPELADTIRAAKDIKPIYTLANGMAASAAYWLGAQGTKMYATPSSEVGSIGVWSAHTDFSKAYEDAGIKMTLVSAGEFKTEGNPWEPLADAAKADMQASVDRYHDMFLAAVAAGRDTTKATVRDTYGRGRLIGAETAKAAGMIDGIATLPELLAGIMKPAKTGSRLATASAAIALERAKNN